MTLSKTTLFSTLTAVAISILSIHSASADSIVRTEKLHSSANRSYKVAGKRYTPMIKVFFFVQTGNASWYVIFRMLFRLLAGRLTISGSCFDAAWLKVGPTPPYLL